MNALTAHEAGAALEQPTMLDLLGALFRRWKLVLFGSLLAGLCALGAAFLVPPTFTARAVILPPQQQQSSALAALSNLGALSGLPGSALATKSQGDQFVSLMLSANVTDRLIDRFELLKVYDSRYRDQARKDLFKNTRITYGKKDGLIVVEVDDHDPRRAAELANAFIAELRRLTNELALTEAQQRRAFFDAQLRQTRDQLTKAQSELQRSGFDVGALRAEPKAAAEGYARLQAEVTAAEVRLQTLRRAMADSAPEVQQQQAALAALRSQLARLEATGAARTGDDYVGKYREYKYQETLFELFSRQYEMARLDESRDGAVLQVVDSARPPERKSKPSRALIAIAGTLAAAVLLSSWVILRAWWRLRTQDPAFRDRVSRLSGSRRAR